MASFRRTLSPAHHERSYLNSPNYKLFSDSAKQHSSSSAAANSLRRLFASAFFQKRKSFRRSFYRCVLFFAFGFLLGLFPYGHVDSELRKRRDFSLETNRGHVNVQLDESNAVIKKRREDDLGINVVSLGVNLEKPNPYNSFNNNNNNNNNSDDDEVVSRKFDLNSNDDNSGVVSRRLDYDDDVALKQLIVVTPTYNRAMQGYFLRRLGNALKAVRAPLLWMVVEMGAASGETAEVLRGIGVMYRHLVCVRNATEVKDRGVHQRNVALEHIERHRLDGIVYFADDDNVYSVELFERLRDIRRFGTWPVAMLAQGKNRAILEGPICNGSQVIGWHTNEKSKRLRRFHVDMSGFAFNSTILWDPKRWNRPFSTPIRQLDTVKEGFQETTFIEQIVEDESQMEGIPSGCSKIMNWHLHLEAPGFSYPRGWIVQKHLEVVIPIS